MTKIAAFAAGAALLLGALPGANAYPNPVVPHYERPLPGTIGNDYVVRDAIRGMRSSSRRHGLSYRDNHRYVRVRHAHHARKRGK